jgi:hypothetical protein
VEITYQLQIYFRYVQRIYCMYQWDRRLKWPQSHSFVYIQNRCLQTTSEFSLSAIKKMKYPTVVRLAYEGCEEGLLRGCYAV